jgi:SAM-dependent methyltransferase
VNGILRKLNTIYHETRLGISTRGTQIVDYPDAVYYATMPYPVLERCLDHLNLKENDSLVDIGCGKGRLLCLAARRQLLKAVGVDISAELCDIARSNALKLRGRRTPIIVHQCSAEQFDYTAATVFFLFNPFHERTLDATLTKIRADVQTPARFAYATPTFHDVFLQHGFELYDQLESVNYYQLRALQ